MQDKSLPRTVKMMEKFRRKISSADSVKERDRLKDKYGSSGKWIPFWNLGIDIYLVIVICIYHSEYEGNFERLMELMENMLNKQGRWMYLIIKMYFEYSRWQKLPPIINPRASYHGSDWMCMTKWAPFPFSRVFTIGNLKAQIRKMLLEEGEEWASQWMAEVLKMLSLECARQKVVRKRVSF